MRFALTILAVAFASIALGTPVLEAEKRQTCDVNVCMDNCRRAGGPPEQ